MHLQNDHHDKRTLRYPDEAPVSMPTGLQEGAQELPEADSEPRVPAAPRHRPRHRQQEEGFQGNQLTIATFLHF